MTQGNQQSIGSSVLGLPSSYVKAMRALPRYRWWKPLLALLLAAVITVIFSVVVVMGFAIGQLIIDPDTFMSDMEQGKVLGIGEDSSYMGIDLTDPLALMVLLLGAAVMLPAAGLAALATGLGGFRTLSSVEGKFRMSVVKKLGPWIFGLTAVFFAIQLGLTVAADPSHSLGAMTVAPVALLVAVLITPLQCAAEEYLFRGLIMQALGSWIPGVIIPVALQAIIFGAMHSYNIWGVLTIVVTGLCYALVTVKTGGLEASTLLHTANNMLSFAIASLFASQVVQSEVTVAGFVMGAVTDILLLAAVLWMAKRKGLLVDETPTRGVVCGTHQLKVEEQGGVNLQATAEAAAAINAQTEANIASPAARYCYECGTALRKDANFCTQCGTPVYKRKESGQR